MSLSDRSHAIELILAFADDKHLMGQQHAEWIGVTPFLEEDLAFCSIGQDELGHAALLYELLVDEDDEAAIDGAIDALAFGRSADEYRSCHFVELSTDDWAEAFVRHWMFDLADRLRWEAVASSTNEALRDIAARVEREELFHRMHADGMLDVLLESDEGRCRLRAATEKMAPLALAMFEPVEGETQAVADGVIDRPFAERRDEFVAAVEARVGPIDWGEPPSQDGRRVRSADWAPLMARMREVFELDLEARW